MISPKQQPISDALLSRSPVVRRTPLQILHVACNFLRIWSVYSLHQYLSQQGDLVLVFMFFCLLPASIIFLALQKPWKGRSLPNSQVVPTVINGGIMALYFICWGKGLLSCGPLITWNVIFPDFSDRRALLTEYAGAALGVLSAVLYGQKVHVGKKVGGLVAMLAAYYFLSIGWATKTYSPFYSFGEEPLPQAKQSLALKDMLVPISAGILSALRRVIARRVSLKSQLKRRLHAITVASATCFLFPVAIWNIISGASSEKIITLPLTSWAYWGTISFGIIFLFYIENIAEERLHLVFSSPRHLMVAGGGIILMEIKFGMDFSLLGFLICSSILGFGIYEATSLERSKKGPLDLHEISDGTYYDQQQSSHLPS